VIALLFTMLLAACIRPADHTHTPSPVPTPTPTATWVDLGWGGTIGKDK
jgi:hypothetical protein